MKNPPLLSIDNLHTASKHGKAILHQVNLTMHAGETHIIIGRNGSGKSSLAHTLAGHPDYQVKQGSISFLGEDLLAMPTEERGAKGLFLSFQNPPLDTRAKQYDVHEECPKCDSKSERPSPPLPS